MTMIADLMSSGIVDQFSMMDFKSGSELGELFRSVSYSVLSDLESSKTSAFSELLRFPCTSAFALILEFQSEVFPGFLFRVDDNRIFTTFKHFYVGLGRVIGIVEHLIN